MKKGLLILFSLILISIGSIYFFIPTRQNLSTAASIKCSEAGAGRILFNKTKWQQWWPGERHENGSFGFQQYTYNIEKLFLNNAEIVIHNGNDSIKGKLQIVSSADSSMQLQWESPIVFSANPFTRLMQYFSYVDFKKNIDELFGKAKVYFEKEENIYGMKISRLSVTESSMISTTQTFSHYPTTLEIYSMINSIKEYIKKQNGEEDKFPMLNVHTDDSLTFEAMVAIPVKKDLPAEGNFALKKFPNGNMLMAEIKGGYLTVIKEEHEFTNYVNDYNKHSPAIPFQSLVTNRMAEPDSAKWITRLYYPVFY